MERTGTPIRNWGKLMKFQTTGQRGKLLEDFTAGSGKTQAFDMHAFLDGTGLATRSVAFGKNDIIFRQGDLFTNVLYLQEGSVKLSAASYSGKIATVALLSPGDFFSLWCLSGQLQCATTASATRPSIVRFIPRKEMAQLLRKDRSFSDHFIFLLLALNNRMEQALMNVLFNSTEQRLMWALLSLAQNGAKNDNDEVVLPRVSQALLGEMIGSTRAHVNGFMTRLKRLGLIEYNEVLKIRRSRLMACLKGIHQ
jgi:CRP/FNR family transcriptional regulator, cyclic AMP receptor protein